MDELDVNKNKITDHSQKKTTTYVGDVFKLVSGTVVSLVVSFITTPLITRLYAPSAYGLMTVFLSICTVLTVISCLRYENAIPLPKSDEEAINLLVASIGISTLFSILLALVVIFEKNLIVRLLKTPELSPFLIWIPVSIFFGGIATGHPGLNYWITRRKNYEIISIARVGGSVITDIVQLGAAFTGFANVAGLIISNLIGGSLSTIIIAWKIWKDDWHLVRLNVRFRSIRDGLNRYRKFPIYDAWGALINSISWQLPSFLLLIFFSPTVVGYYALCNTLLKMPMTLIGGSIAQVFYQRAAQARLDGTLAEIVEKTFRILVILGLFPFLILAFIGPELFAIVFGRNWAEAGVYAQILGIWIFFWFISSPISAIFLILEKQKFALILNSIIFISRLITLFVGGLSGDPRLTMILFSVSGVLVYGYMSFRAMEDAGVSWSKTAKILAKNIGLFIPSGLILFYMKIIHINSFILIGIACLSMGIYFLYIGKTDQQINGLFQRLVIKKSLLYRTKSNG